MFIWSLYYANNNPLYIYSGLKCLIIMFPHCYVIEEH